MDQGLANRRDHNSAADSGNITACIESCHNDQYTYAGVQVMLKVQYVLSKKASYGEVFLE